MGETVIRHNIDRLCGTNGIRDSFVPLITVWQIKMPAAKKVLHTSADMKHLQTTYLLISKVLLEVDAAGDSLKTTFVALNATNKLKYANHL